MKALIWAFFSNKKLNPSVTFSSFVRHLIEGGPGNPVERKQLRLPVVEIVIAHSLVHLPYAAYAPIKFFSYTSRCMA